MSFKIADAWVEITAKDNVDAGKRAAESKLASIRDKKVSIDADTKLAEVRIRQIESKLNDLRGKKTSPKVGVQTATAEASLARLQAKLSTLRDRRLKLDVDAGRATSGLNAVAASAKRADSSVSKLGSKSLPDISLRLAAGLAGIPALAGAAAAAIAAIPAAGAGLGLVGGVLAGSFSGVGAALKGFTADQNKAAAGGGGNSAANAARSSARAIRDATQQINDARRDAARVAVDTAEQVADAERAVQDAARATARAEQGLADAKRAAARTARDAAQQVADAEEGVADAERQAARSARDSARAVEQAAEQVTAAKVDEARAAERAADTVAAAGRRVQQALRAESDAQKDLTAARADATRQLADLQEKVSDLALDEEGATLAVQRAQENLTKVNNDALATDLDKAEAAHELRVAQERLSDVQRDQIDAAKENNQAQVKGVEGADKVVDAKLRLEDATAATADAEHDYREAQEDAAQSAIDSAKRVADAEQALTDARERQADAAVDAQERVQNAVENLSQARTAAAEANADAAERVQQAEDGVSDAIRAQEDATRSLGATRRHAAEAQADAAERVRDAELGLKDAQEDANAAMAVGGAAAASKFAQAMAKLSPLQRDLVNELLRWKTIMHDLGRTGSDAFLPGFIQMLKDAEGLQGIFNSALQRTGGIMGDTARRMGVLFKSEDFKKNLDALLKSTDPITKSIGNLFVDMTGKLVEFGAKMAPASAGFAKFIDSMSKGMQGFFDELGPHADSFGRIWVALGRIMETLLPILGRLVGKLADELVPILERFADWLDRNQDTIGWWADKFAEWAPYIAAVVLGLKGIKLVTGIVGWAKGIVTAIGGIIDAAKSAVDWLKKIKPPPPMPATPGAPGVPGAPAGKPGGALGGAKGALAGLGLVGAGIGGVIAADDILPKNIPWAQFARDGIAEMARVFQGGGTLFETLDIAKWVSNPVQMAIDLMGRAGHDMIEGLFNGIRNRFPDLGSFFSDTLPGWILNAFKVAFGIASPSTVFAGFGGDLMAGLLLGLTRTVGGVLDWFSKLKDAAVTKFTEMKDSVAAKAAEIVNGITSWFQPLPGKVNAWFTSTKDQAIARATEWKNTVVQRASELVTGLSTWIQQLPGKVNAWFQSTKDQAVARATEWKNTVVQRANELLTGISQWIQQLPGKVNTWFNDAKTQAIARATELKTTAVQRAQELFNGIMAAIQNLPSQVQRVFINVKDWAIRELNSLRDMASQPIRFVVDTVYNNGIKPMWNSIAGVFNLPRLATGGILPGYTPGRDSIVAALSPGEAVMRPEWTRAAGADYIHGANRAARTGGVGGAQGFIQQHGLPGFALGGIVGDLFTGGADAVRNMFSGVLGDNNRTPGQASNWRSAAMQPAPRAVDGAVAKVKQVLDSMLTAVGVGGGAGVQRWAPVVLQALSMMGQPASLLQTVLRRMNQESGGNPLAINNWDSNAARGTPSKGLMQTIDPTFRAYHFPGTSNSPYDPLANILASMRYAMARYGSLAAAYNRAGGYDDGGIATGAGMLPKRTPRPERVLSPDQTRAFERLVEQLDTPSGTSAGGVTIQTLQVNVTGVLDFRQRDVATRQVVTDLITAIDAVKRSNS